MCYFYDVSLSLSLSLSLPLSFYWEVSIIRMLDATLNVYRSCLTLLIIYENQRLIVFCVLCEKESVCARMWVYESVYVSMG